MIFLPRALARGERANLIKEMRVCEGVLKVYAAQVSELDHRDLLSMPCIDEVYGVSKVSVSSRFATRSGEVSANDRSQRWG